MIAFDSTGDRVGVVEDVYVDRATGQQSFVLVGNGAAPGTGSERTVVPLFGARENGAGVVLGFQLAAIANAPLASADEELTPQREEEIYARFGVARPATMAAPEASGAPEQPTEELPDDAMTRSEEQLVVDKVEAPVERVRLVKHVVTEEVTVTVSVRREELRLERDPITDPEAVQLAPGTEIGAAEMEFFLLAEEPVVTTRVVPVERVRIGKDAVTESRPVTAEVRKEQIDVERDAGV